MVRPSGNLMGRPWIGGRHPAGFIASGLPCVTKRIILSTIARTRPIPHENDLPPPAALGALLVEEARQAGLLDDKTEHVSFRAPRALIDAAKRETGLRSTTELGLAALAILARPDPVAAAMRRTRGSLGPSHTLEY